MGSDRTGKRFLAILLALLLIAGLTACGANSESGEKQGEDSVNKETKTEVTETPTPTPTPVPECVFDTSSVTKTKAFTIDGDAVISGDNTAFDGLGMVSANNSSRLLLDYKAEQPEAYNELLEYLFGDSGLKLQLIKIEMGADVNSSSGTEPAVKRSADETADVTRGAGYQLAADAAKINPDIAIDMLYWGIPNWVANADDTNEATYQWYKQTIDALYDTYGLKVSYVTVSQNEKAFNAELIKYIANALENETDERYDYGSIQIVAGEGVCSWPIAAKMLQDEELMNAVDVVTSHYTSYTDANVRKLQSEYGKKVWFSEGAATMSYSEATYKYDSTGTGLADLNGTLDVAVRLSQAMTDGMTMYEFQPAIASYYSGATYFPKQLICANEPWNGTYKFDPGYYMTMHFTQYILKDWHFVADACFGDGTTGGDGHAMVDSTYNYVTAVSEDQSEYSVVFVNQSAETIEYDVTVANLAASEKQLFVRETKGPDEGATDYYENFYQSLGTVTPVKQADGTRTFTVVVAPYSIMSISTREVSDITYTDTEESSTVLRLPYSDDFEYTDEAADYLESRGNAPRYTTDQGGAFEVNEEDGNHVLTQQITWNNKAKEWGGSPDPVTTLGDDRWHNYTVSADVRLASEKTSGDKENYAGIGARYILANAAQSGYWCKLSEDGTFSICKGGSARVSATLENFDAAAWHSMSLTVNENVITAVVDGNEITYTDENAVVYSGRIAFYSAYEANSFDNLTVTAAESGAYITRYDDMDSILEYSAGSCDSEGEGWYFNTMCSFTNFNRTITSGEEGDSVTFTFDGTGFALIGTAKDAVFTVEIDGQKTENVTRDNATARQEIVGSGNVLLSGTHTATVTITGGTVGIDALEIVE